MNVLCCAAVLWCEKSGQEDEKRETHSFFYVYEETAIPTEIFIEGRR